MRIELLVVADCPNEAPAYDLVQEILATQGVTADVAVSVLTTDDEARSRDFAGSPTFLLDGKDPFALDGESAGLSCRVYPTSDGLSGLPDRDELARAIARAAAEGP